MNKSTKFLLIFALASFFAGALILGLPTFAYAEQSSKPWNVDVDIKYGGDVLHYDLSQRITNVADEADNRGFYLGFNGKKTLANDLLGLGIRSDAVYEYLLPGFKSVTEHFSYVNRDRIDSKVNFSTNGFTYSHSQDGVKIDVDKLFNDMLASRGKRVTVILPLTYDKAVTESDLRKNTVKKGSFTTTYYNSAANRCHNISLAANSLNGITVKSGDSFSFNDTVGKRTEINGYKTGKVIVNGEYVDGVGGGVCQVSTTLYNALLLAGFIPRASQHSLVSSYVMAGFDAMVADNGADLTFTNDTDHDIYIAGKTQGKTVTFTVYGEPNKYEIVRENVEERQPFKTVEVIDKTKYPELIYADQTKVVTNGSDGVKSKSYLKYYLNGNLTETKLIRSNNYKRVDKVIATGYLPREAAEDGSAE